MLTPQAAFTRSLMAILRADSTLAAGGVFNTGVQAEAAGAYLLVQERTERQERAFGARVCKVLTFALTALWRDAAGANYANGEALLQRCQYLCDGGSSQADFARIQAAFNAQLDPLGYFLMSLVQTGATPLLDEAIGPDETQRRYSRGYLYTAFVRGQC